MSLILSHIKNLKNKNLLNLLNDLYTVYQRKICKEINIYDNTIYKRICL